MTLAPTSEPGPPDDREFLSMEAAKSILGHMALSIVRLATFASSSQSSDLELRNSQFQELTHSLETMIKSLAQVRIVGPEDDNYG